MDDGGSTTPQLCRQCFCGLLKGSPISCLVIFFSQIAVKQVWSVAINELSSKSHMHHRSLAGFPCCMENEGTLRRKYSMLEQLRKFFLQSLRVGLPKYTGLN